MVIYVSHFFLFLLRVYGLFDARARMDWARAYTFALSNVSEPPHIEVSVGSVLSRSHQRNVSR